MVDGLNKYTETLPDYFVLIIWLVIKDKMKFKIEFKSVSLSHLMGLVSFKYTIQKKGDFGEMWNIKEVQAILISDLLKLCIFRYKKKNLILIKSIYAVAKSKNLYVLNPKKSHGFYIDKYKKQEERDQIEEITAYGLNAK